MISNKTYVSERIGFALIPTTVYHNSMSEWHWNMKTLILLTFIFLFGVPCLAKTAHLVRDHPVSSAGVITRNVDCGKLWAVHLILDT